MQRRRIGTRRETGRWRVALLAAILALGCGPRALPEPPRKAAGPVPIYRPVKVPKALAEEDIAEARAVYGGIPVGAPERASYRRALLEHDLERVARATRRGKSEAAFAAFSDALALWDAAELRGPVDEPRLARDARTIATAWSRRGAEREVLTALHALHTLSGNSREVAAEIERIHGWLDDAGRADPPGTRWQRLIDAYEAIVRVWPSPAAVERLHRLYLERQVAVSRGVRGGFGAPGGGGVREMLAAHASFMRTGFNLARLYLRVDQPERALEALKGLAGQPGEDPELLGLLEKSTAKEVTAPDELAVARHLGLSATQRGPGGPAEERGADLDAALRVCRDVIARFPQEIMGYLCAGEMAYHTQRRGLAIRVFEAAQAYDPARREPYDALSILYYQRFRGRLSEEALQDAKGEVANLEKLHAEVRRRWPDQPLQPPLAASYLELGRGYYNFGKVDEALQLYDKSLKLEPLPETYEQMGLTYLKLGDHARAIQAFERASGMAPAEAPRKRMWEARLQRLIGDAHDLAGRADAARRSWRSALAGWDEVLQTSTPRDDRLADALVERGRLLVALGDPDEGLRSFDRAIETDVARADSYVDAMAFLVPRGYLEQAAAIFRRAAARPDAEVSEYFKAYAALWIIDLARLRKQPPDDVALSYLDSLDGPRWYVQLARFALGRVSRADLEPKADAPGKRCELLFYEAMRLLAAGDRAAASELWRKVIATGMLGYFEYDMAAHYLRRGPPPATPKLGPAKKPRPSPPPRKHGRDGSL
ncbi:MAG: tetratricopeptide repeat protein [Deltaproteobacteria bacterium]|nr:tetratricopeptide repeat protein [Deltaproteobacteria bacterium]